MAKVICNLGTEEVTLSMSKEETKDLLWYIENVPMLPDSKAAAIRSKLFEALELLNDSHPMDIPNILKEIGKEAGV